MFVILDVNSIPKPGEFKHWYYTIINYVKRALPAFTNSPRQIEKHTPQSKLSISATGLLRKIP